jgi:hypothetical protein
MDGGDRDPMENWDFPSLCCWEEPVGDGWNEEHRRLRNFHREYFGILVEFLQPQCSGGDKLIVTGNLPTR